MAKAQNGHNYSILGNIWNVCNCWRDAGGNFQYILGSRRKSKLKFV